MTPGFLDGVEEEVLRTADGVVIGAGSVVYEWRGNHCRELVIEAVGGGVVWERVSGPLLLLPENLYSTLAACAAARGAGDEQDGEITVRLEWARRFLDYLRAPRSMVVERTGERFVLRWPVGGPRWAKGKELGTFCGTRGAMVAWLSAAMARANEERFKC